jgi:flagellar P-ring protein precursor FlgI
MLTLAMIVLVSDCLPLFATTSRIKDIARIGGVRKNQLVGYGLIVGLDGTGDKNIMTAISIGNLLKHFGVTLDPKQLKAQNSAAVMVTATIDPFLRPGDQIDVLVSSIGDAKAIRGGVLLQTPLKGGNGLVYAVAQGPISIGGVDLNGGGQQGVGNHATVARIPSGAFVEREIPFSFSKDGLVDIVLNQKDFSTANSVAKAISGRYGENFATAVDAGLVQVRIPRSFLSNPVAFLATIEGISVETDATTKIIINEKTGTIVIGSEVRISPVVIAHGDIRLRIQDKDGNPMTTDKSLLSLETGVTIQDLVETLNSVGVTSKDIMAILQSIRASGALQAEIEVI